MNALPLLALAALSVAVCAVDPRGDHPDAPPSAPQEQLARFHVPPGFEVQLVAAEPGIQKPLSLNFDAAGRLWASCTTLYPWPARTDALGRPIPDFQQGWDGMAAAFRVGDQAPAPPPAGLDSVRILSDFGPQGAARRIAVFADGLSIPTGLQPLPRPADARGDSAIVFSIPTIWRMTDTDGDGRADLREPLYEGFGFTDTHGMSSNYLHWIDGWIYGCHGFKNHSAVKDRSGRVTVFDSGNTYRFRPDGSQIEPFTHGQTNPYGLTVDPLGHFFSADSHSRPVMLLLRGGSYAGIGKTHDGLGFAPTITDDDHGSSAIAGLAYYADDQFPEEYRGNLFNGNPVTRRINRDRLEWHGGTPRAIRMPDFLTCDDPWFRPVQVKLGPDGALWIADFYTPIIGHYEVPLTDPRRDHTHGRIWRVVWRGHPPESAPGPSALPDLTTLDAAALVEKLAHPNLLVRTLATHELVARVGNESVDGLRQISERVPDRAPTGVLQIHSLWALERLGAFDATHLPPTVRDLGLVGATQSAIYAERPELAPAIADGLRAAVAQKNTGAAESAVIRRAAAIALGQHPDARNLQSLLAGCAETSEDDAAMRHTLDLALRDQLLAPLAYAEAERLSRADPKAAARLAAVSLGVKTPEAAGFLFGLLKRDPLESSQSADFLRHIVLHLPAGRLAALSALSEKLEAAPLALRLSAAHALAAASRERGSPLPGDLTLWSHQTMLTALTDADPALVDRAIAALRDVPLEAKREPLRKIVSDPQCAGPRRAAALESLTNLPEALAIAATALRDPTSLQLRQKAAEWLGSPAASDTEAARAALLTALPTAPDGLALVIAVGLARSDAGCSALLDAIARGQAPATLLRHRFIAYHLAARAPALRDRAAALTQDLPPENEPLQQTIAERAQSLRTARPDAAHGAHVFQLHCAVCHRFRNAGGNVGPNLDAVAARGVQRLLEDILDPQRNVDPAFYQTTLETRDGQTFVGANLRDDGTALTLTDATGKDATFPAARIQARTTTKFSLMPSVFATQLPATDLHDLLAYLLGGAPRD